MGRSPRERASVTSRRLVAKGPVSPPAPQCLVRSLAAVASPPLSRASRRLNGLSVPSVPPAPPPSSAQARSVMLGNRSESAPERALRSELHRRGSRFRKHASPIKGLRCRPDILFTRRRIAVFVDGCFWHRCPLHGSEPKVNGEWWQLKLGVAICPLCAASTSTSSWPSSLRSTCSSSRRCSSRSRLCTTTCGGPTPGTLTASPLQRRCWQIRGWSDFQPRR